MSALYLAHKMISFPICAQFGAQVQKNLRSRKRLIEKTRALKGCAGLAADRGQGYLPIIMKKKLREEGFPKKE